MATINPTRRHNSPIWNLYPFTCPRCLRSWKAQLIRMKRLDGRYVCHRCHDEAHNRTRGIPGRAVDAKVKAVAICATCSTAIGRQRAVVNTMGLVVHYRCPVKKYR